MVESLDAMVQLPIISEFTTSELRSVLDKFPSVRQISSERRTAFSGNFPLHTRYFSNGDRPLVCLAKSSGEARLHYDGRDFEIPNGAFVFFDDNVSHSWIFKRANLEIYYYRFPNKSDLGSMHGDYCLDNYF